MADLVQLLTSAGSITLSPALVYLVFMVWRVSTRLAVLDQRVTDLKDQLDTVAPPPPRRAAQIHRPAQLVRRAF